MSAPLDALPGFRRRITITPARGQVRSELEDDFHCMSVVLTHENGIIIGVTPGMARAPWTTCPGAIKRLEETFTGCALQDAARHGEKTTNCTHLYDLALWAAAHAHESEPLTYDVLISDPVGGKSVAALRKNGAPLLHWTLSGFTVEAPSEIAGLGLMQLSAWMATLPRDMREPARVLRWGAIIAHGRAIPLELQSDASKFPSNCHTFQPENARRAKRVGEIRDFSVSGENPLELRR